MAAAYERFIEALQAHGYKIQHHGRDRARSGCPGHGGEDLNLSIAVGDQGVLLKCHSHDCPAEDIATGVGLKLTDLWDNQREAVYEYDRGHRVRRQRTRDGKKIFQENKPKVTSLYRHPMSAPIETSDTVVLVEGEKCVDAALRLGETCVTTWPGGAKAVDQVDLSPLAGKTVRIIADNDEPGLKAGFRLVSRLEGIATIEGVWVVPGEKRGVDDLWVDGGTLAELEWAPPPPMEETDDRPRRLALTKLSTVRSRAPRFLWEGVMPLGAVTVWGGRGGVSKSTFAIHLAGMITTGTLPGALFGTPHSVLYVSHEDSLEEVVALRCQTNGVDMDLFHHVAIESKEMAGHSVPRLPEDMPLIREAIEQTGAKLIIIDPITSTVGGDNDKLLDVRAVMDPLNQLGIELGVSVIAIAHFRKGGGAQSDLISGSGAYRDASRCVLLFARDHEIEGKTVLTVDKSNYGRDGHSFQYTTEIVDMLTDDGQAATAPKINWHGESEISVGDLVNREQRLGGKPTALKLVWEMFQELGEGIVINTSDVMDKLVPEFSRSAVTKALTDLKDSGKITSPIKGMWRRVHEHDRPSGSQDQAPHARPHAHARAGGDGILDHHFESGARSSNVEERPQVGVSNIVRTDDQELLIPPAREDLCTFCGYPLPAAVIADGERVHPNCDR